MAKRLTDTDKWKRPWFRTLPMKAKLIWIYLLDQCDHNGIWPADFGLMSFQLDSEVTESEFQKLLGPKVIKFDGDKYFIPSFFEFQYGDAKEGFKAKQSALKTLMKHGLINYDGTVREQLPNSSEQSKDCTSIGIGISTSKSISTSTGKAEETVAPSVTPSPAPQLVSPPKPKAPAVPHLDACVRTWQGSLDALKVPRKVTEFEKQVIARALIEADKYGGVEQIDLALYGARHEPDGEGYDPKDYADAARVLLPNKRGQSLFTKFVGWGATGRAAEQAKSEKPAALKPVEGEAPPAEVVRQMLGQWSKGIKAMPKPSEEIA